MRFQIISGPEIEDRGRIPPSVGRIRPRVARIRPNVARFQPDLVLIRRSVGQSLVGLSQISPSPQIGHFGKFQANSAKFELSRPILGDVDQSWCEFDKMCGPNRPKSTTLGPKSVKLWPLTDRSRTKLGRTRLRSKSPNIGRNRPQPPKICRTPHEIGRRRRNRPRSRQCLADGLKL